MTTTRIEVDPSRDLLRRVRRSLAAKCHVGTDRLLVGVSGGSDSVALLRLLDAARSEGGYTIRVAHFDHRLRPNSADEARFVCALAERLGYEADVGCWDAPHPSEAAARTARLQFLQQTAQSHDCTAIVLGHQLDDRIETLLMRLGRGSGPRGLGSMRWRRRAEIDIVRPLLDCRRDELVDYLRRLGQDWRDDDSNQDLAKTRNRVRHLVLPALDAALDNGWHQRWGAALDDQQALASWLRTTSESVVERARDVSFPPGTLEALDLDAIQRLAEPLRRGCLLHWLDPQGRCGLRRPHVVRASRLVREGREGTRLALPGARELRVEAGKLIVGASATARKIRATGTSLSTSAAVPSTNADAETSKPLVFTLEIESVTPEAALLGLGTGLAEHSVPRLAPTGLPSQATTTLCADRLRPPFAVRSVAAGERVRLLGAPGSRRLVRLLQDKRIPARLRAAWPVVADAAGIVWIPGVGIAERGRLDEESRSAVRFRLDGVAAADAPALAEVHDET